MEQIINSHEEPPEVSRKELYRLSHLVSTEITTRMIYKPKSAINFIEFFNICFPLIEHLREAVRSVQCPALASSELVKEVRQSIVEMIELNDKWNMSYTAWYSHFRANPSGGREVLTKNMAHIYEVVQTYAPNSAAMAEDCVIVIKLLDSLATKHAAIVAAIPPEPEHVPGFFSRLFNPRK